MTQQEIYFWTSLPRIGAHLMTSSILLYFFACMMAGPFTLDMTVERTKHFRRIAIIAAAVASLCAWGFTLVPTESQVQQIIKGELK